MRKFLERLAVWYLEAQCGRVVIPRYFTGAIFGYCYVRKKHDVMTVYLPFERAEVIVLNNSILINEGDDYNVER